MQKILGFIRKAVQQYHMIEPGDRVAVGVSGGKDSVALLKGLALFKLHFDIPFDIVAITLDPCFGGVQTDYTLIAALCAEHEIPYIIKRTEIGSIIFDIRKETNPCSLCARMRRGALHDTAKEQGCNKIALGHHKDDAVETFLMNLFNEGRIGCFSPVTYLSRKDLTMIRPLVFAEEKDIRHAVLVNHLPVVKSTCPADGKTERERIKQYIIDNSKKDHDFKKKIFGAMLRAGIDGW